MSKNQLFMPNDVITVVINILLCLFLQEKHYNNLVVKTYPINLERHQNI